MYPVDADIRLFYVEEVAKLFHEKHGKDAASAAQDFIASKTYAMLADPEMGMLEFGTDGIFSIWESELITGDPRNSSYIRSEGQ